jgi:indole-3-glycerol phosphate synthase
MSGILDKILAHKETEVAALDTRALRRAAESAPAPRDMLAALTRRSSGPPRLIAELQRASPSRGLLAPEMDLLQVASVYAENGASAISVLTDQEFFLGTLETLRELRFARPFALPLLRKDFIIAEAQVYESRANGADAILLIAAALADQARLACLHALALELGLAPLVEVHNAQEMERALGLNGIRLIGINNRDLATFEVSLETTEQLRPRIPASITVVSESGIASAKDVERLAAAGVDAILVGEALVTAPDIAARVRELAGLGVGAHD